MTLFKGYWLRGGKIKNETVRHKTVRPETSRPSSVRSFCAKGTPLEEESDEIVTQACWIQS